MCPVARHSIVVIGLALVVGALSPRKPTDLPGHFDSPVMAMYMVTDLQGVRSLVNEPPLETTWKRHLRADVVFALAYGWLFCRLAKRLTGRPWPALRALGYVGAVASVLAALFDLAENAAIAGALSDSAAAAHLIRPMSLAKWGLLGLVAVVLAVEVATTAPIDTEAKLLRVGASAFFVLTALIAAAGMIDHVLLERVATALGVAVLLQAAARVADGDKAWGSA